MTSTLTRVLRRHVLSAVAALVCGSAALGAHDLWIEPSAFTPATGAIIAVRLRVGQDLTGDPVPRDPALLEELVLLDPAGRTPIVGRDGADPAGLLRIAAPGLHVIGYRSRPSAVTLTGEKFNQYLKEEGLDAVLAQRTARGLAGADARELFSRCAKTLVISGAASPFQMDRTLGCPLELIAEGNPYATGTGRATLPVRLLFNGRPLAGALVVAFSRADPSAKVSARTDRDGRVVLPIARGGLWLVKSVHMVAAKPGSQADWESFWASLTFGMGVDSEAPDTKPAKGTK